MVKLSRIVKDYCQSGAVNAFVNIHSFISDSLLLTKSGDLVVVLKVEPRDYECLDPDQLASVAQRFAASVRSFDPRFRLYQHTIKRECTANLFVIDSYFVVLYEVSSHNQVLGDPLAAIT